MTQAIITVGNIFSEAFQGLFDLVHDMKAKARHRQMIRETRNELLQLTDHELKDLGIGRSDIESIARGTFHSKRMDAKTEANDNLRGWV
tara:strand:- start:1063 stop:1329 length:267 start_codon:yes stop_codon:yes gene_type:complete